MPITRIASARLANLLGPHQPPDFQSQCHLTKLSFSCEHEMSLKDPEVFHTSACTYVFEDKDTYRCMNLARVPKIITVHTHCPNCSNLPGIHRRKYNRPDATEHVEVATSRSQSDPVRKPKSVREPEPEVWKLPPECQVTGAEIARQSCSYTTRPNITLESKQESWSDSATAGTESSISSDKWTESPEAPSSDKLPIIDVVRPESAGGWVEVEGEPDQKPRNDDQDVLAQEQTNRWSVPAKWLIGFIGRH